MKRAKLPLVANEVSLKENFVLEFVFHGPSSRGWEGDYLHCPKCKFFVLKGGDNHECPCGNVSVDADMLRVVVQDRPESQVDTYRVVPK